MIDVVSRALKHPFDYYGVLNTRTIVFREKVEEQPEVWSFIFDLKKPFSWKAGQHAIFTMPDRKVSGKTWRAFSIASSAREHEVRIGTNIPLEPSSFKQHLMQLETGDNIRMHGPFGELHTTSKTKQIVGVAGGIGITPFRALAYDITHGHIVDTSLHLIYAAGAKHTYKEELEKWNKMSPSLTIEYIHSPEEVNASLTKQILLHKNNAHYFLSGAPKMIDALRKQCEAHKITKIKNDPFKGY